MYDPRFRFALLISIIVAVATITQIIYSYILGDKGLDFAYYISGVTSVGGALVGGFLFVWICTQFITFEKFKKTGFEATYVDETGTGFNFPVSLSKYLPDIVAPPYHEAFHPLEMELLGFLNGYRYWPYDITGHNNKTLYQHAIGQWNAMKSLPGAGPLHRIAALAQNLSLVHAYTEKRKIYPYWQFWKQDKINYSRKCIEHGGISAFILSTMPQFRKLGTNQQENQKYRRALLTAIRYCDNPTSIPANCDPLAKELYEYIHKARQVAEKAELGDKGFDPTDENIKAFNKEVLMYFQAIIRESELNPADITENNDGVYLGAGKIIIRMSSIIRAYANVMSPQTRGKFNLWTVDSRPHVSWPYFIDSLRGIGVVIDKWEEVESHGGLFNLKLNSQQFPNSAIIELSAQEYPDLRSHLDSLPKWNGMVEIMQEAEDLSGEVQRKAAEIDRMIRELNSKAPTQAQG